MASSPIGVTHPSQPTPPIRRVAVPPRGRARGPSTATWLRWGATGAAAAGATAYWLTRRAGWAISAAVAYAVVQVAAFELVRGSTDVDRGRRPAIATIAGVTAVSAMGGAIGLIGGAADFGAEIDARLPFESLVLAGVALAAIVGIPSAALAVVAWRGDRRTGSAAVVVGVLLIGWIAVQVGFIQAFSWFQPAYVLIGSGFVVAGRRAQV